MLWQNHMISDWTLGLMILAELHFAMALFLSEMASFLFSRDWLYWITQGFLHLGASRKVRTFQFAYCCKHCLVQCSCQRSDSDCLHIKTWPNTLFSISRTTHDVRSTHILQLTPGNVFSSLLPMTPCWLLWMTSSENEMEFPWKDLFFCCCWSWGRQCPCYFIGKHFSLPSSTLHNF